MSDMAEDRVYADRTGGDALFLASDAGVTRAAVANGRVGRFSLEHRCTPRDLAVGDGWLAVATDEDVLVRPAGDDADEEPTYRATGFGPATAVGADGADLLAATPDSEIARLLDAEGEFLPIADVDAPVRAIDGDLVAAGDGVYRVSADGLDHAGLDDARDVATATVPLAATGDGLFRLGNGWLREADGVATVVAARGERALSVVDGDLRERDGETWATRSIPREPAALAIGERPYAVTADGEVLAAEPDAPEGWRRRSLGLPGVVAAVVGGGV
jgi:hypothetical protein